MKLISIDVKATLGERTYVISNFHPKPLQGNKSVGVLEGNEHVYGLIIGPTLDVLRALCSLSASNQGKCQAHLGTPGHAWANGSFEGTHSCSVVSNHVF